MGHTVTKLDEYLSRYFVTAEELSALCDISPEALWRMVHKQLVMQPSYIVSQSRVIESYVFGKLSCDGARNGCYFRPATKLWVRRAVDALRNADESKAYATLKATFERNFTAALQALDRTMWRLRDCMTDDGAVIQLAMQTRLQDAWNHHLHGVFGLCVVNPESEAAIAIKEVCQEKLAALSDNGGKEIFSYSEAEELLAVIDEYAMLSMPFSPVEYSLSSRHRLVDNLRPRVAMHGRESAGISR